jgi:hypothetical protein
MLSWIFRHCARLTTIYPLQEPLALAGERFVARNEANVRRRALRPGELRRARGRCEMRPRAKRVGPLG